MLHLISGIHSHRLDLALHIGETAVGACVRGLRLRLQCAGAILEWKGKEEKENEEKERERERTKEKEI